MKHRILLVDAERRSVRVLSVALRSAGYSVRIAGNGLQALDKIEAAIPDVIVSDSQLPKLDGYGLVEKLKANPETENIPVLLVASNGTAEDRERGRRLGVSDYLPKPVFVRELLACIGLLIARSARAKMAASITTSQTGRYSSSTRDVSVVDLLQTFELLRESGVARLLRGSEAAEIYFRDGRPVDARLGRLRGEQAIYAALLWSDAALDVEFKTVKKEDIIDRSVGTLLVEGMRRVDAWGHIYEQLRPLTNAVEVDQARLLEQIASRLSGGKALSTERGNALLQGLGGSEVVGTDASLVSRRDAADDDEDEDIEDEEYDEDGNADANDDERDDDRDESEEDDRDDDREDDADEDAAIHEPANSTAHPVKPGPVVPVAARASVPTPVYEGSTITLRAPAPSRAPAPAQAQGIPTDESSAVPAARGEGGQSPRAESPGSLASTNGHAPPSQSNGHAGLALVGTDSGGSRHEIALRPAASIATTTTPREPQQEDQESRSTEEPLGLGRPSTVRPLASKPVVTLTAATAEKLAAPVGRVGSAERPEKSAAAAAFALPSTPPWTHEIESDNEPAVDADGPIPGVSTTFGRTGRILIGAGVALALILGVVTGLRPSSSHSRASEEAHKAEPVTAVAAAPHAEAPPPPVAAVPADSVPASPEPSATEASSVPTAAAPANPVALTAMGGGGLTGAAPSLESTPPAGNEFHPVHHSPLVAQAEQALMKGATDRAIVLAGQAVAAAPADADAWLALGAAHRAAGDDSAARADYRNCIAQAHSEDVNHCRVLAEH